MMGAYRHGWFSPFCQSSVTQGTALYKLRGATFILTILIFHSSIP